MNRFYTIAKFNLTMQIVFNDANRWIGSMLKVLISYNFRFKRVQVHIIVGEKPGDPRKSTLSRQLWITMTGN